MQSTRYAITGAKGGGGEAATERAALMTVSDVARALNCSTRTVYRLADSGRIPRPIKLGALVRWPRQEVAQWIAAGCPSSARKGGSCV